MRGEGRVGYVRCVELPEPDPDETLVLDALRAAGIDAATIAWDDPKANAGAFDLCLLRSCWNYPGYEAAFRRWLVETSERTTLLNPLDVVQRNLHKSYLRELEADGIPVVPTAWVERGSPASFDAILDERGWNDVVIKPAVSAGSYRTRRFRRDEATAARSFLTELSEVSDTMVQLYVPSVETERERALIWIDGEFTHAVHKTARFAGQDESVSAAEPLSSAERTLGEAVLSKVEPGLLYARVDVMLSATGALLLSELELVEPSLFFLEQPAALTRFVSGVQRRL